MLQIFIIFIKNGFQLAFYSSAHIFKILIVFGGNGLQFDVYCLAHIFQALFVAVRQKGYIFPY